MTFPSTGNTEVDKALLSILITVASALILRTLQPKGRIRYYSPHQFTFLVPQANQNSLLVYTRSLRIENIGRDKATGIEIHHAFPPENFSVFPSFDYTISTNPERYHILKVPSLGPKEGFWLEILQTRELPMLVQVRSDAGQAKSANVGNFIVFPKWVYLILWALILIGLTTIVYLALSVGLKLAS